MQGKLLTQFRQLKRCLSLGFSLSFLVCSVVYAHAGHNDSIQLRVKEQQLGVEIGLNAADFIYFDRNQDATLSRQEFVEQQDAIKQWLQTQIQIKTEKSSLKPTWFDLPLELETANLSTIKQVRLIQRYDLPAGITVKFQSQMPSFKGKSLMFSSNDDFYMTNLNASPVEILLQAGNTE